MSGALTAIADGVWIAEAPVSPLWMRLTSTMTVLRLADGTLLVHSPVTLTPERRDAVAALGDVAHLYAPNTYHHLAVGDWAKAFPSAKLHAPPGLAKKRPDLHIDRISGAGWSSPEPSFAATVDEIAIDGCRLEERALFHHPSRTLVVADVVHNIGRPAHWWTKIYTQLMGFYDRVAISRAIRALAFPGHAAARRSIDALLALPFERLVVGHGAPITDGAHEKLAAAYVWLPPAQASLPSTAT